MPMCDVDMRAGFFCICHRVHIPGKRVSHRPAPGTSSSTCDLTLLSPFPPLTA